MPTFNCQPINLLDPVCLIRLIQIHILNDKQCRSRSVGVSEAMQYPSSAGPGLKINIIMPKYVIGIMTGPFSIHSINQVSDLIYQISYIIYSRTSIIQTPIIQNSQ